MIKQNEKFVNRRISYTKNIFVILTTLYISGLVAGCSFAVRNNRNMDFVKKVTLVSFISETRNMADLSRFRQLFIRDILSVISVLILKYSGVLKGLCVCIPFIIALQNSCLCTVDYRLTESAYRIITEHCLRSTATAFIIIIYCTYITKSIIKNREDVSEDGKKTVVYSCGIILVYILDFTIRNMFS